MPLSYFYVTNCGRVRIFIKQLNLRYEEINILKSQSEFNIYSIYINNNLNHI